MTKKIKPTTGQRATTRRQVTSQAQAMESTTASTTHSTHARVKAAPKVINKPEKEAKKLRCGFCGQEVLSSRLSRHWCRMHHVRYKKHHKALGKNEWPLFPHFFEMPDDVGHIMSEYTGIYD